MAGRATQRGHLHHCLRVILAFVTQFGKKLQAAMIRKLQESDVTTQWSLTYKLNNKLRMQFNITSAPPFPKTLLFQFSSEGAGSM